MQTFEEDLRSRAAQMESVQKTGKELEAKATASDAATIHAQLQELTSLWQKVTQLSERKSMRLEEALKEVYRIIFFLGLYCIYYFLLMIDFSQTG